MHTSGTQTIQHKFNFNICKTFLVHERFFFNFFCHFVVFMANSQPVTSSGFYWLNSSGAGALFMLIFAVSAHFVIWKNKEILLMLVNTKCLKLLYIQIRKYKFLWGNYRTDFESSPLLYFTPQNYFSFS